MFTVFTQLTHGDERGELQKCGTFSCSGCRVFEAGLRGAGVGEVGGLLDDAQIPFDHGPLEDEIGIDEESAALGLEVTEWDMA